MPFLPSQSEKHIRPESRTRTRPCDYGGRKSKTDLLFRVWQEIVLWAVLLAGSYFVFFALHFRGLEGEQALEIASRGRALLLGRGDRAEVIRPLFIEPGRPLDSGASPLIPPLYPRIQAVLFRSGGLDDAAAVMAGGVFFLAAALAAYGLARKRLPKKAALLVFLFTFTNPVLLRGSLDGRPTSFLVLLMILIFLGRETLPRRFADGAAGLLAGLAFLADYSFLAFVPPLFLLAALEGRGQGKARAAAAAFLAGLLAALIPWLAGRGGGALVSYLEYRWNSGTAVLPEGAADGLFGIPLNSFALPLPMLIGKFRYGVTVFYREGLLISGNLIGFFFWAAAFSRAASFPWPDARRNGPILLLLASGGLWMVLLRPGPEILAPLLPLVILQGTEFFLDLRRRYGPRGKRASRSALTAFIALNCLPLFFNRPSVDPLKEDTINSLHYLRTLVREEELILTDIPARVAWYGNRRAVRLPLNPEMGWEMLRSHPGTVFLLLSPGLEGAGEIDPREEWRRVYHLREWPGTEGFDQVLILPGRLVLLGEKTLLLNRISARW